MIRKLLALFFSLVFLLAAAGGLLFFTKDWWVKAASAAIIKKLTGFDTTIQDLQLDPKKGTFRVRGLTLLNPYQFNERVFADLPEVYVWLDLPTLMRGKGVHLYDLRLDIRELNVEKNTAGVSNISLLTPTQKLGEKPEKKPEKKPVPFYLERLVLSISRIRYHDRSGVIPKRFSIDMGIQGETFKGIDDPKSIVNLVLLKVIKGSPLGPLGLSPTALENRVRGTVNRTFAAGDTVFFGAPSAVSHGLESTEARMEGAVNKVEGTVGKTVQGAKSGVTRFFGGFRFKPQPDESATSTTSPSQESPAPA